MDLNFLICKMGLISIQVPAGWLRGLKVGEAHRRLVNVRPEIDSPQHMFFGVCIETSNYQEIELFCSFITEPHQDTQIAK